MVGTSRFQSIRTRVVKLAVAAVALIVLAVLSLAPSGQREQAAVSASDLVSFRPDGTVLMARPGVTAPVLEVYEDYQCPYCRDFERLNGGVAREWAVQGKVALIIHPFTVFSENAGVTHDNSRRALTASLCVTDPRKWLAYHDELYAHQPEETLEGGFPVEELVRYAKGIGIAEAGFTACLNSRETSDRADALSRLALDRGVQGTPTIRLDGRDVDWSRPWATPAQQV
ncbi:thioredoxin domain-containing protein [Microtetraspora sp. NBRC 16547]|uniref:DsbA family protein n=1 Tax=Microtetraspora sp. NBRC 16547 TaxID=3030993 RepID=UPI0024A12442|nr:thioredoxin domain-containing protein [Microtetraspora sp. NBRC 16547]GLX02143.1 DSBA oxidoreductase [Microtetraspora sp. NBRC 16547]